MNSIKYTNTINLNTNPSKTICLNMIVKNESHIIIKTLTNILDKIKIDYWVIGDNGSTDNTQELIQDFFDKRQIPGELYNDTWVDFGHNRSKALERAYNKTDYVFIFDADDEMCGDLQINYETLVCDSYDMQFRSGVLYMRKCLVSNRLRWKYTGVLHEYIECIDKEKSSTSILGNYHINSIRAGSRSKNPNKYLDDAIVLEKAYHKAVNEKNTIYNRYVFYCANSYKDAGKPEKAIEWYKKTLEHDGWIQERYVSCLYIYELYSQLKNIETGMYYLVKAHSYDANRVEAVYELIKHYCCINMNEVAYTYYTLIQNYYENKSQTDSLTDKLFVKTDDYYFYLPYYMIIVSDKVKKHEIGIKMYEIIFDKKIIPIQWWIDCLLHNLQFFIDKVPKTNTKFFENCEKYFNNLYENGITFKNQDTMNNLITLGLTRKNLKMIPTEEEIQATLKITDKATIEKCKTSKNILFYIGFTSVKWNITYSLTNSLGGSERAVIYLIQELSKILPDYNIYVSGDVGEETIGNIKFVNLNKLPELINTTYFNTIIISRYIAFFEMFTNFKTDKLFIWTHDVDFLYWGSNLSCEHIINKWNNRITNCMCMTQWHKKTIIEKYPVLKEKIQIINNGINPNIEYIKKERIPYQFIYTSRPERGLSRLLELWPSICKVMPNATLKVSSYEKFPENDAEREQYKIMQQYSNIEHLGKLTQSQLYEFMSTSEYWLYPNCYDETSCITALEMLFNGVICIYYPNAGLVDTIGDYGIKTSKNNEITDIMNLTEAQKQILRTNGQEYANNSNWTNRAKIWKTLITSIKQIAIYNGFSHHNEMFGYIINYCIVTNIRLVIYTKLDAEYGWIDFYKMHFSNVNANANIEYRHYELFENERHIYDKIILTTDDDKLFNKNWANEKYICIDHHCTIRQPAIKTHLGTRKFIIKHDEKGNEIEQQWATSCYPIIKCADKQNALVNKNKQIINIAIVGSWAKKYDINVINRLTTIDNSSIVIHVINKNIDLTMFTKINSNIELKIYNDLSTSEMIKILTMCNYMLTDVCCNIDHLTGKSMSGGIPLAFSTLTPLIISKQNNELYNFKNVVEFDINDNSPIELDNKIDIQLLELERTEMINNFTQFMNNEIKKTDISIIEVSQKLNPNNCNIIIPKKIIQTWETKELSPEFQKIVDTWKINNPDCEYYLFDKNERIEFIKDNFDKTVLEVYNSIVPGAAKADLFRYCYLYCCGGITIDIDTLCIGQWDNFILPEVELVVPIDLNVLDCEGKYNLACGIMASIPKHPALLDSINRVCFNVKNNFIPQSRLDFTGPGLFGRSVNKYLGNDETESFVGKEGIVNNIHFLKFEIDTEYFKDVNNNILGQNKNGNQLIKDLYYIECEKLKNYTSWVMCQENELISNN